MTTQKMGGAITVGADHGGNNSGGLGATGTMYLAREPGTGFTSPSLTGSRAHSARERAIVRRAQEREMALARRI